MPVKPITSVVPGAIVANRTVRDHQRLVRAVTQLGQRAGSKRFSNPARNSRMLRNSRPGHMAVPKATSAHHVGGGKGNHKAPAAPKNFHAPAVKNVGGVGTRPTSMGNFSGQLATLLRQAMGSITNPNRYADAVANSEYNAPISTTKSQIAQALAEGQQHLSDIGNWYGQVGNTAHQGQLANAVASNAAAGSADASTKAIIEALGGSANAASGSVGALGSVISGGIRGAGANQAAFDNNLMSLLAGEGAEQKTAESRRGAQTVQGLRSQLTQLVGEKGSARAKAYNEGISNRFGQLGQLQNMILGQQLAGPQLEAANLANTAARQNINRNYILNQTSRAQLEDFMNQTSGGGADKNISQLTPAQRAQLSDYLTTNLLNKQGFLNVSPKQVKGLVANRLFGVAGYGRNSPGAQALLAATVAGILTPGVLRNYDKRRHTAYSKGIGLK